MRRGTRARWLAWGLGLFTLTVGCGSSQGRGPSTGTPDAGSPDGGQVTRVCEAGDFQACDCATGATGRRLCNEDGSDFGACSCGTAGTCTATDLEVSGTLATSQVDIDFTGGDVSASASHKVDVDVIEDGCVTSFGVTVEHPQGGCVLELRFSRNGDTGFGGLTSAKLTADSHCPGFPDPTEGVYTSRPGFAPWSYLGPQAVPQRMASTACTARAAFGFPDKPFRLYRTSPTPAEVVLNLEDLRLFGDLFSRGSESARCIDSSGCGPRMRDGGDGWCVATGQCSPGYHDSGGQCVPSGTCLEGYTLNVNGECTAWKKTTSLPAALREHASAALRDRLYVVGGVLASGATREVWSAAIGADGQLGSWRSERALPGSRAEHRLLGSGDDLYVVGGRGTCLDPSCKSRDILRARVAGDGTLGEWTVAGSLPEGITDHATVIRQGVLYVVGGWISTATGAVLRAPLQQDGALGAWSNATALPRPLFDHAVVAVGGFLYVLGGYEYASGIYGKTSTVLRAPVDSEGSLGAWQPQPALPADCDKHTAEAQGGYVYLLGGACTPPDRAASTRNAWHAWLGTDGTVAEWIPDVPFLEGRSNHSSTSHGGRVYVLGGTTADDASLGDVQFAPFKTAGGGFGP